MGSGVDEGRCKPKKQQRRDHEREWKTEKQKIQSQGVKLEIGDASEMVEWSH